MKINLVSGGVSKNSCEIGSRSMGSLDEILNLWIISAANVKYSISASRFPTEFRFPTENGQTFGFFVANLDNWVHIYFLLCLDLKLLFKYSWNSPLTRNRSGLNTPGSGKSFGLCITAKRDAITRYPSLMMFPSTSVSWMHTWGTESATGRNLKFSCKTALKYGHFSTTNCPVSEKHSSSSL